MMNDAGDKSNVRDRMCLTCIVLKDSFSSVDSDEMPGKAVTFRGLRWRETLGALRGGWGLAGGSDDCK